MKRILDASTVITYYVRYGTGESKEHTATTRGPYEESVELVRTKRHCHGFLECEPGLWLVFVLSNRQVYSREY